MSHYLDHAATTPVHPQVARRVAEELSEFGNPSSTHGLGAEARGRLAQYRGQVADALGCKPEEFIFTSGGTEGDNWAVHAAKVLGRRRGKHIITTAIEHSAMLAPIKALEAEGYTVTRLVPDKNGVVSPEDFAAALREDTILASVMLVNNELGSVQPVAQCAKLAHEFSPHILFHTDAVQGFLKIPFTPAGLGVDLLTVSAHKIRGPKGVGGLYHRPGLKLPPLLLGGGQENGLRPGTESMALIAGLAEAARLGKETFEADVARMGELKDYAIDRLTELVPGVVILTQGGAPHILAVSLPGYPSEMLVRALSDQGVYLSSGSACHKGKPSHVFAALGLPKRVEMGALRLSLSPDSGREDVDALAHALARIARERVGR